MHRPRWLKTSLARKVSLLLGSAVLLTIVATLLFPSLQMSALSGQVFALRAQAIAQAVANTVDLQDSDWGRARHELQARWPDVSRRLGLSPTPPALVQVDDGRALDEPPPAETGTGGSPYRFRLIAIEHFRRDPTLRWYWRPQADGEVFRFAMAVRGSVTDNYPHVLRGIIDVSLPTRGDFSRTWNWIVTVLSGATGAVLAILVFYLVTQRLVLSKVATLREVAQKVATGDMTAQSHITSGDEFQQLSEAFNNMLTHLRTAQTSLSVRLDELSALNRSLDESNRIKTDFLSNVSHELRTPLVSIIGFAELLRDAAQNPSADTRRTLRFAENILTSGRSLLELINDLLDLAKMEAGKMSLHVSAFSLEDVCGALVDLMRPESDKRRQTLTLDVRPGLPPFHSDSGKIKQILFNLLSNAIKFTPPEGTISLTVEPAGDAAATITVRDSGPGIPPDKQEVIFEKFMQIDSSRTREYEGTGLGLAITRNLATMLGGRIHLESEPGHGATFVVRLPARIEAG